MKESIKTPNDNANCHVGTPKGKRTIITIGEVKGIIEHQKASGPSGFSALYMAA
jgi:hypothetical protein